MTNSDSNQTPRQHGPWQIVRRNRVYQDPWLAVEQDDVIRPDGNPGSYVVAHLKPGVSVIALDSEGRVYLTNEFHYGVGRNTIESASGGIDEGETPLQAARRELREELGIIADSWTDLGTTDPFTANVVSPTTLFLARELTFVEPEQEGTELIEPVIVDFEEAVQKALSGEISHAPSALAILKSQAVLDGRFGDES